MTLFEGSEGSNSDLNPPGQPSSADPRRAPAGLTTATSNTEIDRHIDQLSGLLERVGVRITAAWDADAANVPRLGSFGNALTSYGSLVRQFTSLRNLKRQLSNADE